MTLSTTLSNEALKRQLKDGGFSFSIQEMGLTSRRQIRTSVYEANPGTGIVFFVQNVQGDTVEIPAIAASVVNTLRNVTLGKGSTRICIVEHLLAALTLYGLEDVLVEIDGPELPLGDGSANSWLEAMKKALIKPRSITPDKELKAPCLVAKGDRSLLAVPDQSFSITYLMDWPHPAIGKKWFTWIPSMGIDAVAIARTFAPLKEHQLLGLQDDVVSLTDTGFTKPLHFDDEPVRHKVLDLIGDLTLLGFNPLRLKARVLSTKGGHEMDVDLVRHLANVVV